MKYDPKQIKKEFKASLNKKDIKEFDNIMFYFIAEKVFKEIKFEDYKKTSDLVWRVLIDTVKFLLHYGLVFREVLAEIRRGKKFKEDLKKELKLNEEYTNLVIEVLKLRRYKLEDFEVQEKDEELDA